MLNKLLKRFADIWQKLSDREKRLAKITAAVVAIMAVVTIYQRAMGRIEELDAAIFRLEDDLVSYTYQIAHREIVEARYAAVAAQHSSAWTEAEIHDRLRQEIYRLARKTPPPLDENGIPQNMPNEEGNLVEIPSLGKGSMAEGGAGYREYMINLRIPPVPLENIVFFLERLQQSPQSLRVDALELNRAPDGNSVSASIDITRIVADGAASAQTTESLAAETGMGRITLQSAAFQSVGAEVLDRGEGAYGAVEIRATEPLAHAFMSRNLPSGASYEMIIDLAAAPSEVDLGIGLEKEDNPFDGIEKVVADGSVYRYHVQFTLPALGGSLRVKCPWFLFKESGDSVRVTNLLLRKASEV